MDVTKEQLLEREKFLNSFMHIMASEPNCDVVVVIASARGLQTMATFPSPVYFLGMLDAAQFTMRERLKAATKVELLEEAEEKTAAEIEQAIKNGGGVN